MTTRTASIQSQIADLTARRTELHESMTNAISGKVDSTWFRDRVNEMAYLNRSLDRLVTLEASLSLSVA